MKIYGKWSGNEKGVPEDPEHCIEEVPDSISWKFHQCTRKRGHGPKRLRCKQHAKILERMNR